MMLGESVMWQAVVDYDASFDGKFFYAVKTTGVYCRPSCKSRTPLRGNLLFFLVVKKQRQRALEYANDAKMARS